MDRNMKGQTKIRRPLPIRILAVIMALAMVLSVVYINNRNDVVKADEGTTPTTLVDATYLTADMFESEGTYTIYVPIGELINSIDFTLPEIAGTTSQTDVDVYYIDSTGELTCTVPTEETVYTKFIIREKTTESYAWYNDEDIVINSIASKTEAGTATATLKKTVSYTYETLDSESQATITFDINSVEGFTPKTNTTSDSGIILNITSRDAADIAITSPINTATVTADDADAKSDDETSKTYYYGDVTYSYGDVGPEAPSVVADKLAEAPDGTYEVKKQIKSGEEVISEKTKEITKNSIVIVDSYATIGDKQYSMLSDAIDISDVTPEDIITLHIITDAESTIELTTPLDEGLEISPNSPNPTKVTEGYDYSYDVKVTDVTKAAGKTFGSYTVTVADGVDATLSKSINISIKYLDSNPKIESITAKDAAYEKTADNIYYYGTAEATVEVVGTVDRGDITELRRHLYDVTEEGSTEKGVPAGISVANKETDTTGKITGTVEDKVPLETGDNYISYSLISSYGQEGLYTPDTGKSYIDLFYDDQAPEIKEVEIDQEFDANGTTKKYNEKKTDITDGSNVVFSQKISSKQDSYIYLTLDDNGGSDIKSVTCDQGDEAQLDGAVYKYKIAASDGNNAEDVVYKFTITDQVGNTSTVSVNISYYDDEINIKDPEIYNGEVVSDPFIVLTGGTFLNWKKLLDPEELTKSGSERSFKIRYTVEVGSDFELSDLKYTYKVDGSEKSVSTTESETTGEKNTYYLYYEFDGTTRALQNLVLTVSNPNGSSAENPKSVINIDSDKVLTEDSNKIKVGSEVADPDKWYSNLVLNFLFTDSSASPYSGIAKISNIKGAEESGEIETVEPGSGFNLTINETATEEASTAVSFDVEDAVGNKSSYSGTFKVDKTSPKSGLKITGTSVKEGEDDTTVVGLKSDPTISYSPTDVPSGIVETKTVATIEEEGGESKSLSKEGKALSDYFSDYDDSKTYIVKVYVEDEAGNSSTTSKKFKVDGTAPISTLTNNSTSKKNNGYYDNDVNISLTADDTNLVKEKLVVTDSLNGGTPTPISISWTDDSDTKVSGKYTITSEGRHKIQFTVEDESGNTAEVKTLEFTIDKQPPAVTPLLNSSPYSADNSYNKTVTTGVSYTDDNKDDSDVTATIVRSIPGGGSSTSTKNGVGPFTISEDGYYTVTYVVVDKAGNRTTSQPIGFTVDNTAPVHNLYVTTSDPAKVEDYPNNYINNVGRFTSHKSQEAYRYGQYYNSGVTVELNYFDYNIDQISVTDNGTEVSVDWTRNGAYGKASYTTSEPGYHDIQIWSKDKSGNVRNDSELGKRVRFTIDNSAPSITTYVNSALYSEGSGVRYLNTNGSVSVSVDDGNKDTYDLTRYYKMTPPGGSATTGEDKVSEGTENYATEADYEVQYIAVDKAGNKSAARNVYFRVDKTAPQLTINGVGASSTAGTASVSFNVREAFYWDMNSCQVKIYKKVDGSGETLEKTLDMNPTSNNYSQSYTFTDDAEYRMEFTAEDKCGNKSQTDYSFIKDGNAPSILLSGVSNYDKTDKAVTLQVTIEEAFYTTNKVKLTGTRTDIDGETHDIGFNDFVTNRSRISELEQMFKEDGIYDITVVSTDKAGNSTTKTVHFTIDTTDPEIGDLSKYDGVRLNSFDFDIDLDDLVRDLTVCDIKVYLDGALYDGTSDIGDGSHVLKIEATDELGHTSSKEVTFVLDTIGPNIIVTNVESGDNLLESTDITVTVELDEDTLDSVQLNGETIEMKDNQGSFTVSERGSYELTATAHDEAGNKSSIDIEFTFGKQTNLVLVGIIAGILILLLILLLVWRRKRANEN